ncbi:MAG: polysaccharide biosynthesis C-terminal domain-containing protein, partial [Firmicutes bacterium]|nr:polysaccharide biosynthesis C-terminal domain-containing protein [Candidatus Colimorpha enterica]
MKVKLSDHFTYSKLLKFVLPSVAMMIVTSIYGVVDGLFIANFSSKTAYAAVNFIFPAIMILSTPGFMLGTGGGALVSKALGENEPERANRLFSLFVYAGMAAGLFFGTLAFILMPSIATLFGAGGDLLSEAVTYGRIVVVGCIPQTMHFVFQSLSSTAEKPEIEFRVTLAAGCTNVIFDALFVGVFKWGAAGAAVATVLAQCVSGFTPFIYFIRPNTSLLRLSRPYWDGRAMLK